MSELNKIPENIMRILDQASEYAGKCEAETFSQSTWCTLVEGDIKSPIEQALYIGFMAVIKVNVLDEAEPESATEWSSGLVITPQRQIGKYRADFTVCYMRRQTPGAGATTVREVVVECDGTAFHERTERERRHEKARDRYMQKLGMKVFRYTGREILDDPYKVAAEIIGYVTDDEAGTLTPAEYFK